MIRWHSSGSHLDGFMYFPMWEVCFGVFLMITAVSMPVLFIKFNGIQMKQYPEWLFVLGFLLFFFWMGHRLAYQWFEARMVSGKIRIHHNLRDPGVSLERSLSEWTDLRTGNAKDETGRVFTTLQFIAGDGAVEIYRSIDPAEVKTIKEALGTLRQNSR